MALIKCRTKNCYGCSGYINMQAMLSYRTMVVAVGDIIILFMRPFLTI